MRKLALGNPQRVGGWVLLPVELTFIRPSGNDSFGYFYATKEPHAVLLVGSDGPELALDTEGREISIDGLVEEVPALGETLADVGNLRRRFGL